MDKRKLIGSTKIIRYRDLKSFLNEIEAFIDQIYRCDRQEIDNECLAIPLIKDLKVFYYHQE